LNPHVDLVNVLVIDGKRFEHVRGVAKFYLPIAKLDSILFITDESDYSVTYHILNMSSRENVAIPAHSSVFGRCIGEANSCDTVVEASSEQIVLQDRASDASGAFETRIYLDLKQRKVVAENFSSYDPQGKLVNFYEGAPPF
jgi:hypothetical protein